MIFSKSPEIIKFTDYIYESFLLFFSLDYWITVNIGAIRGIGKQGLASINNLISYYIIELPLAFYLAFYF